MILLAVCVTLALALMLTIAAVNMVSFPRLQLPACDEPSSPPCPVSVLIPARDEAATIAATVTALLAQPYPRFEVIVLDDHSTDGTAEIAQRAGAGDPRLCVLTGAPLPDGWLGKPWACHQLAQAACHDLLIFTHADVRWQPGALPAVTHLLQTQQADLLTVWPGQLTLTWSERLVVPLMALAVLAYLPVGFVHHTPYPLAAAANGQCMVFRRSAYARCGGHAAVRQTIVEDVRLAQLIKETGLQLRMADGNSLLQTRMYGSWHDVRNGYAKNILAGHGNSPLFLMASTLFHLLVFVGPWLWLLAGAVGSSTVGWPLWPFILILLGVLVRGLTAATTQQRPADAWLMPVSTLLMTWIAGQALWWHWRYGGPQWKGRVIRTA